MKTRKSLAEVIQNRILKLLQQAEKRFTQEEMIAAFNEYTGGEYMDIKNDEQRIIEELTYKGYIIIKPESLQQQMCIEEKMNRVFPNECDKKHSLFYI